MAFTNFNLAGPAGTEQVSPAVALAAGEIAQVRFTNFAATQVLFEVTRNGLATREVVTDGASDLCTVLGPASVILVAKIGHPTHRVAGILEGV